MSEVDMRTPTSERLREKLSQILAEQLRNPETGDVVFAVNWKGDMLSCLYAWKHILSANNQYFSASETTSS